MATRTMTAAILAFGAALLACMPAGAVVGGREDPELGRHAVMVLNAHGGFCSAAVIAPDVLLTAGHCVTGNPGPRIHWRTEGDPVLVQPAAIAMHPGYVPDAVKKRARSVDLALVRLREPLPAAFAPVALDTGAAPRPGDSVTVGGYGIATEGDPTTGGHFRTTSIGIVEPYGPSKVMLWLSDGPQARTGACGGDSGGPVFAAAGGLVAITAFAEGAGTRQCGALTQAVLVAPQRAWIEKTLSGWGAKLD